MGVWIGSFCKKKNAYKLANEHKNIWKKCKTQGVVGFFFWDLFVLERQIFRKKEKQKDLEILHPLVTPQMTAMAEAELIWSQKSDTSSLFPTLVQGLEDLGH